jgi:citrate lyase subunit beta/citryl-CoA lyase
MTRVQRAWRSLLFVPVLSERFLAKAHERGADAIILDLEDSILPVNKAAARAALPAAVPRVAQAGADVVVRINRPLDLAVADIAAAVMPGVAALMLPKVMGPEHVRLLAELVTDREAALGMPIGHTRFLALIESPAALPHVYAIAAEPRMAGMSVGGEDMATELGAIPSADSMYVFAMQGLAAARTAGILPMGSMGQLANIADLDSYRSGLKRGKALGFITASCIHPAHVPIINEEYGASDAELDRARRLLAAFDAAAADGAGAVAFEGSMIDLPVVIRAQRLLERAKSWARSGNPSRPRGASGADGYRIFHADIAREQSGDRRSVVDWCYERPSRTRSAENEVDIDAHRLLGLAHRPGVVAAACNRLHADRVGYSR